MNDLSHIPVRELFNSLNGGISFCLEYLADWLVHDGREGVLRSLEEKYEAAHSKRDRECLFFLIDGISRIDLETISHHVRQIAELFPALMQSNEADKVKVERTGRTLEEWNVAAERFKTLLNQWSQWIIEAERLRLEGIRGRSGRRGLALMTRHLQVFQCTPAFDSPVSLRRDQAFFMRKVEAVTQAIEQGHLANRLPEQLDVRDFYHAKGALIALQSDYEELVVVDASANEQDNALWAQYRERVNSLIRVLWTMGEAQLWSLFWLYHPEAIDRPAI
jgi:hypothetical protein